jgi:hypothetical protein
MTAAPDGLCTCRLNIGAPNELCTCKLMSCRVATKNGTMRHVSLPTSPNVPLFYLGLEAWFSASVCGSVGMMWHHEVCALNRADVEWPSSLQPTIRHMMLNWSRPLLPTVLHMMWTGNSLLVPTVRHIIWKWSRPLLPTVLHMMWTGNSLLVPTVKHIIWKWSRPLLPTVLHILSSGSWPCS